MTIRPYRVGDRDALVDITLACFDGASSVDQRLEGMFGMINGTDWRQRKAAHIDADIAAHSRGVLVAEVDGIPVGFVSTRVDHDTAIGRIPNLAVLAAHRRGGIGRKLLDAAVDHLRGEGMNLVRIETLASNSIGCRFYPDYGFREVARQVHYVMPIAADPSC